MDRFKVKVFNLTVDLDDPETYKHYEWRNWNTYQLHLKCIKELGYALMYMKYLHPLDWGSQAKRVDGYCKWFAQETEKHREDTAVNRVWYRKFLYRFLDEVENLC